MATAVTAVDSPAESAFARRASPLDPILNFARRKPVGAAAGLVCIILILIALSANTLAPYPAAKLGLPRLHAPSLSYPLGTDNLFRDMFSRVLIGSQISLGIGIASVLVGTLAGTVFGLASGYVGGWLDLSVNRFLDCRNGVPATGAGDLLPEHLSFVVSHRDAGDRHHHYADDRADRAEFSALGQAVELHRSRKCARRRQPADHAAACSCRTSPRRSSSLPAFRSATPFSRRPR